MKPAVPPPPVNDADRAQWKLNSGWFDDCVWIDVDLLSLGRDSVIG